jgi:hypothetical protein
MQLLTVIRIGIRGCPFPYQRFGNFSWRHGAFKAKREDNQPSEGMLQRLFKQKSLHYLLTSFAHVERQPVSRSPSRLSCKGHPDFVPPSVGRLGGAPLVEAHEGHPFGAAINGARKGPDNPLRAAS